MASSRFPRNSLRRELRDALILLGILLVLVYVASLPGLPFSD
jgi:hypothetical protein